MIASYGYDTDSRVTSINYGTGGSCTSPPTNLGTLSYTYDAAGRRTALGGTLAAVNLPANLAEEPARPTAPTTNRTIGGSTFGFDASGNLTSASGSTYTFDGRNHLTAIGGSGTASFVYDAFGRRVNKTVSGSVAQFIYDGFNPLRRSVRGMC